MITCRLCNGEFEQITYSHLKYEHGLSIDDYRISFPNALLVSDEFRQRVSASLIGNTHALGHILEEETRQGIAKALTDRKHSEETCRKRNASNTGRVRSEEQKERISEGISKGMTSEVRQRISATLMDHPPAVFTEESRRKISEAHTGKVLSEETLRLCSEAAKRRWKDPKYQRHQMESWHLRPTQPELEVQYILDKHHPDEWKYVGDGQVWIGGRNPDFINVNSKKQVVEVFGVYWHHEDEVKPLIAHYKEYGFDCLVIWECDTLNEDLVVGKVRSLK